MKKITLVFFILFTITIQSQTVVFHDSFKDDKNKWVTTSDNFKAYIKRDALVIENIDNEKTKWLLYNLSSFDFNPDQVDFDLEVNIKVTDFKKENATYGLVWSGYNDNSYYDVFRVTPDKQLQLYQYLNGTFDYYSAWKSYPFINGKNKNNYFKVEKRANLIFVYLNGNLVHRSGERDYYGSKIGFILDANMTIVVDEVKVTRFPIEIDVVDSFDPNVKIEKLPEFISSKEYEETNPVISADGQYLYVDRKDCDLNLGGNKDDIWYSVKDEQGNWTALKNMGKPLNNEDYNFVISSSPDNNMLLLGNRYTEDGKAAGSGVSVSRKTAAGWEIPKSMTIKDYANVNMYVGYFLANDNKHLIMSVERKDQGLGKKDLYVSFLEGENLWSKPVHLGNVVNTFEDETNPFLASDGKTLYFASRGHKGYGGYDLFVTKRLDDTWQNWSPPKNLGNVINSKKTELSIFLSAKGDKAYLSRSRDIWEIDNSVKQDPVVLVKGKVFDAKTNEILSTTIVYNNLVTDKELGTAISDPTNGSYSIVLPFGEKYSFMAQKEGYFAVTQNVDLSDLKEYKEITVNLYLNPIEKGQTIRLNNIFFDSGKYDLLPESNAELDRLYKVLRENQKLTIEIAGHTDAVGSDTNNMTLSNKRANAVMNYLTDKGIAKDRLTAKGYGETKFIATNETEEGKQQNRRVEFVIIEL
ncbi:OmpA family protein [Flavobacterium sp. NRK F10]|uniref:OmpA family protein n=1 Tax=Flavobacterium sp. NRK F10 TaxID=2954931 RepID=UPI002090D2B4|nr:OmpA family protein [Flavobacterium sp. NRK F10]MCO6175441.1 OmpA family protein [Flavobacterium sp. NRK F10]